MDEMVSVDHDVAGNRPTKVDHRRLLGSPYVVAGFVLLLYAIWLGGYAAAGYSAHDMILISKLYATQSHTSSVITYEPSRYLYARNRVGYDGQFFYFIAADPIHARAYVDNAPYRYTKILYPMLARALALGRIDLIPYSLLLINWIAVGVGTGLVAKWLYRRGISPWFALAYGLFPGIFIGFQRDLTEPMSYALVAWGVYLLDSSEGKKIILPAFIFAFAVLTRDKAAVFPAMYGAGLFFMGLREAGGGKWLKTVWRNAWRAAVFFGISVGPLLLWKLFLLRWLRSITLAQEGGSITPLKALTMPSMLNGSTLIVFATAVVPGCICAGMALWALYRREWDVKVWTLLVVTVFSIFTLDPQFYRDLFGMFRVSSAVILSALYCLPTFDRLTRNSRKWLWGCLVAWFPIPFALALFGPLYVLYGHA